MNQRIRGIVVAGIGLMAWTGLAAPAQAVECVECAVSGSANVWTPVNPTGGAVVAGSNPAAVACQGLTGTPTGQSYTLRAGATCGTACSNATSACATVGATQCDYDFFADDIEMCSGIPGTTFECRWLFATDCCSASPRGDTCTQTGTVATCGRGGCGLWDDAFGMVLPHGSDDESVLVTFAAVFVLGILLTLAAVSFRSGRRPGAGPHD